MGLAHDLTDASKIDNLCKRRTLSRLYSAWEPLFDDRIDRATDRNIWTWPNLNTSHAYRQSSLSIVVQRLSVEQLPLARIRVSFCWTLNLCTADPVEFQVNPLLASIDLVLLLFAPLLACLYTAFQAWGEGTLRQTTQRSSRRLRLHCLRSAD